MTAVRRGEAALLILAKYPTLGQVKTRLAASIGVDAALHIYYAMLSDSVARVEQVALERDITQVWVHKPSNVDFAELHGRLRSELGIDAGRGPAEFVGYDDESLADQQANELRRAFEAGFSRVIVVNTDTPQLSPQDVLRAFALLDHHDVVLGPTADGGYYLLGVTDAWDLILGVDMAKDTVLGEVLNQARRRGLAVAQLDELNDVDTLADLRDFVEVAHAARSGVGLRTLAAADSLASRNGSMLDQRRE